MTISKKLHYSFGSILAIVVLLFIVNTAVVLRQRTVSHQAAAAVQSVQTLGAVELTMMQTRLALRDYLLTGDERQHELLVKESAELTRLTMEGKRSASTPFVRDALARMEMIEQSWAQDFAAPLIAQR